LSTPSYPSADEYQRALNTPALCFEDADLRRGTPRLSRWGLPVAWSGQFATVFRLETPSGPRAVRCFTAQVSDHQARYAALHDHLLRRDAPMLADFTFLPRGIRVAGRWLPMVKMEWVEGQPLDRVVEEAALEGDKRRLHELAAAWDATVRGLAQVGVTHGDLQHENILVSNAGGPPQMRLVDYDGAFVPALNGRVALEQGHPHYQHPARSRSEYGPHLDAFPALVILLSLQALAVEPGLWRRHHTDKHLILRGDDFAAPDHSALLQELARSPSEEVRRLTARLVYACGLPSERVLERAGDEEARASAARPRSRWQARPIRTPRSAVAAHPEPDPARASTAASGAGVPSDVDWRRTWQPTSAGAHGAAARVHEAAASDPVGSGTPALWQGAARGVAQGRARLGRAAQRAVDQAGAATQQAWRALRVAEDAPPMGAGASLVLLLATALLLAGLLGLLGVSGFGLLVTQPGAAGRQLLASALLGGLTPALFVATRRPSVAVGAHALVLALLIGASRPGWSPLLYAALSALAAGAPLWRRRHLSIRMRDVLLSALAAMLVRGAVALLLWDEPVTLLLVAIEAAAVAAATLSAIGVGRGLRAVTEWLAAAVAEGP
jgi:hypothetical protein